MDSSLPPVRPLVPPDLIVDPLGDGEWVLLHPTEPRWAVSNETGLVVVLLADGSRSVEQIAGEVAEAYGIGGAEVLPDIVAFLMEVRASGLLASEPAPVLPAAPRVRTRSLTVYITEQCNLRCSHCAIVEGQMPPSKLGVADIQRLIDEHCRTFPDNATVSFLGGEPLMHPQCLDLLEHAVAKSRGTSIATNGLLVTEEIARRLAALPTEVQVSLDGASVAVHEAIRGRGTWARTWAGIERLMAAGVGRRLSIAATLTRGILGEVDTLVARCAELGVGTVRFLQLNKSLAARTNWDAIAPDDEELMAVTEHLIFDVAPRRPGGMKVVATFPGFVPDVKPGEGHWCPLGETAIVDSQGAVYTCPSLETPDVTIGNVLDEDVGRIEVGAAAAAARASMLNRRFAVEECRRCAWRNFCQGGCTAYMAHRSGSSLINDQFCDFRRRLYRRWVRQRYLR
ncbi:radical SAM protein [bacterium]|nr:radical SAM protein [bacterium]